MVGKLFKGIIIILVMNAAVVLVSASINIKINDNTQENYLIADLKSLLDQYKLNSIADKNSNGRVSIKYSLLSNEKINRLFRLSSDGRLFTAQLIDREALCSTIDLCCAKTNPCSIHLLIATKSNSMMQPMTFEMKLSIEDINDHTPKFPEKSLELSIKESDPIGSLYRLPIATDLDSEKYDIKQYKLVEKNSNGPNSRYDVPCFILDRQRGHNNLNLQLIRSLDREKIDRYHLELLAIDKGEPSKTGSLLINIQVLDINDNGPVLPQINYMTQVREGIFITEPILTIEASDVDIGENARLFYKIIDENPRVNQAESYFRINSHNGKLYLRKRLDFEKQEKHKFLVEVSNPSATHIPSVTASILINVESYNDEIPEIVIDYLNDVKSKAVIRENGQKVEFVALITVKDKDKGLDGEVDCRLVNFNDLFDVQRKNIGSRLWQYTIVTKSALDREQKAFYSLTFECKDKGVPVQVSKSEIKIEVEDENDNSPVIDISVLNNVGIKENSPMGTLVTKIKASDLDKGENGRLKYSLSSLDDRVHNWLKINADNGEITTRTVIDREEIPGQSIGELMVEVTVQDCGKSIQLSTTHSFVVRVIDENDNWPRFEQNPMRYTVMENNPERYTLGEIVVTDPDETSGSQQIRVRLKDKTHHDRMPFLLYRRHGRLYLNTTRSLDWEREQNFTLQVIASDGKGYQAHTTTATIFIQVEDENDNKPEIVFPSHHNYTIPHISYREPRGFAFITINAKDNDNPHSPNGQFYFSINQETKFKKPSNDQSFMTQHHNLFNINPKNGKISISRQMDKQDIGLYHVQIIVQDTGNPPQKSELLLKIQIDESLPHSKTYLDLNENYNNREGDGNPYSSGGNTQDQTSNGDGRWYLISGGYLSSKEGLLIFSLAVLITFMLVCVAMVLYMRHTRGMFPAIPDIFAGSNSSSSSSSTIPCCTICCFPSSNNNTSTNHHNTTRKYPISYRINDKNFNMIGSNPQSPIMTQKFLNNNYYEQTLINNNTKKSQQSSNKSNIGPVHHPVAMESVIAMLPSNIDPTTNQYRQYETMINYNLNNADSLSNHPSSQYPPSNQKLSFYNDLPATSITHFPCSNYEKLFYNIAPTSHTMATTKPLLSPTSPTNLSDPGQLIQSQPTNKSDPANQFPSPPQPHHNQGAINSITKSNPNLDSTYAVSFPKEQSTFV